jgi:hypothetical protein
MRIFGIILLLVGMGWGGIALNLPTTIQTPEQNIGSDEFQISIPSFEVHNLDLANKRQTQLIMAGLAAIVGSIFIGFGFVASQDRGNTSQAPAVTDSSSLFDAAKNGDFDMAYGLVRDGADINQKNPEGKTALDLAQEQGNTRVVDLLLSNGATFCCDQSHDMKKMPYKYQGLENYLNSSPSTINEVTLSFEQIETIIGDSLSSSALNYREWWANQSDTTNRPQARAWVSAGFMVDEVHQMHEDAWVRFKRS